MLVNFNVGSCFFHSYKVQDLHKKYVWKKPTSITGSYSKIGTTWKDSYFKEEQNSGAFILLFDKVTKALIEDYLFLPLRDDRFVLLEVKRLSHDGKNVVHILLFIKGGNWPMAVKTKTTNKAYIVLHVWDFKISVQHNQMSLNQKYLCFKCSSSWNENAPSNRTSVTSIAVLKAG